MDELAAGSIPTTALSEYDDADPNTDVTVVVVTHANRLQAAWEALRELNLIDKGRLPESVPGIGGVGEMILLDRDNGVRWFFPPQELPQYRS